MHFPSIRLFPRRSVGAAVATCTLLVAACAPAAVQPATPDATPPKPTVRVGSTNFSEQVTLAELYSQVLEANGYRVERDLNLGNREAVAPALEAGRVDLYVEYLASMLTYVDHTAKASADPAMTHRLLQAALKPRGLSVLAYAPAVDTNAFAVTQETAAKYGLAKLSDLRPYAGELVLGGPPECVERPFCAVGLEQTYGLRFKAFRPLDALGPLTMAALEDGRIDVGLFGSSDGLVAWKGFVALEDDRRLQLADNVAPVVRDDLLARAPAELPALLNAISAELTTQELVGLNASVDVERRDVHDVAATWLRAKGLVR